MSRITLSLRRSRDDSDTNLNDYLDGDDDLPRRPLPLAFGKNSAVAGHQQAGKRRGSDGSKKRKNSDFDKACPKDSLSIPISFSQPLASIKTPPISAGTSPLHSLVHTPLDSPTISIQFPSQAYPTSSRSDVTHGTPTTGSSPRRGFMAPSASSPNLRRFVLSRSPTSHSISVARRQPLSTRSSQLLRRGASALAFASFGSVQADDGHEQSALPPSQETNANGNLGGNVYDERVSEDSTPSDTEMLELRVLKPSH